MSSSTPPDALPLKEQATSNQSWWSRQSLLKKLLLIAIPLLLIIGLAVGLGVGLTVGNDDDDGGDNSESESSGTPTPLPTPPSNGTIWQPAVNSTWQIVLENPLNLSRNARTVDPDVPIFDIDLFTNDKSVMDTLHRLDRKVMCYFSAGSYEPGRPDSDDFTSSDKGKQMVGWPDEYWLNISSPNVRNIMKKRLDIAAQKGCDAVDPDNMDGYNNANGLGLTQNDSIEYVRFLASEAHDRNLSIGLKNAGEIISEVLPMVQFSVNEQCVEYSECATFEPFVRAGKPVFHIEYPDEENPAPTFTRADFRKYCATTGDGDGARLFSTLLKPMDLNGRLSFCNGTSANTPMDTS